MKNNKGLTIIEIIASLALISIVLIFLIDLFLSVRMTYAKSRSKSDYEVFSNIIIKSVSHDIDKYELKDYKLADDQKSLTLTYKKFRTNNPDENIIKVLKLNDNSISYKYISGIELNSDEKVENIVRDMPTNYTNDYKISIKDETINNIKYIEISIPLVDIENNKYDIHIYGKIS